MKLSKILVAFLIASGSVPASAQSKKPNIIFILADDLGWGELNSYGSTFNETPNLNKLAAQGTRFTQAYAAAPNCSPTRASIMTGQYPARVGITDFLPGGENTEKWLDPAKYVTLNEALSQQDYHTGIVGKWHLDTHFNNLKGGPKEHGFDEVIGSETKYIAGGDYFFPYDKIASFNTGAPDEYLTDRQSKEAVNFIERNQKQPFFLYLSYYSVHTKLEAPKDLVDKYKRKFDAKYGEGQAEKIFGKRSEGPHKDNPYLAAMLESIDNGVGEIMETVRKNKLEKNTLIVFFSDNGGAGKGANNGNLKGAKMWLYEGGIREPLIMSLPGTIKSGAVENTPVSSVDFYPTFLSLAGGKVAGTVAGVIDGVNIMPLFSGKSLNRDELYWHYPSETAKSPANMSSVVRKGNYKLLEFYKDNRLELYDLGKDQRESEDLSKQLPEKTAELKRLLDQWKKSVNAEEPVIAGKEE